MFHTTYRNFQIRAYQSFEAGGAWIGELVYDANTPVWTSAGHPNSAAAAAAVERHIDEMIANAEKPENIARAFADSEIVALQDAGYSIAAPLHEYVKNASQSLADALTELDGPNYLGRTDEIRRLLKVAEEAMSHIIPPGMFNTGDE